MPITPDIEEAINSAANEAEDRAVARVLELLRVEDERDDRDRFQDDLRWLRRRRVRDEERSHQATTTAITAIVSGLIGAVLTWASGIFNLRGH